MSSFSWLTFGFLQDHQYKYDYPIKQDKTEDLKIEAKP